MVEVVVAMATMATMVTIKPFKNREININKDVYVYRNLGEHVSENWSIMQNGLVVGHTDLLYLKDVSLVIRESGRQRAIKENRRNVHAFCKGKIVSKMPSAYRTLKIKVNYDITKGFLFPNGKTYNNMIFKYMTINDKGLHLKCINNYLKIQFDW